VQLQQFLACSVVRLYAHWRSSFTSHLTCIEQLSYLGKMSELEMANLVSNCRFCYNAGVKC